MGGESRYEPRLGLSVTQAAEQLGVSRVALSRMLNGRAAISRVAGRATVHVRVDERCYS